MNQRLDRFLEPRLLKQGAQAFATATYAALAGIVGRVRALPAARFASDGSARALVVAPHPDDEAAGCAGTLLRHRAAGDAVTAAVVTDGRRSRALGLSPEAMAARRRAEAEEASHRLGVELRWLGLREGEWRPDQAVAALGETLDACRPTIIYAPSALDYHAEHRAAAVALAAALGDRGEVPVRIYPVHVPLSPAMVDRITPVGDLLDAIRGSFDAYASQRGTLEPCLRLRRYTARLFGLPGAAEGFWQLPASAYRRLHAEAGTGGGVRGLRYAAITDPLAFVAGRRLRRELLRRADEAGAGTRGRA